MPLPPLSDEDIIVQDNRRRKLRMVIMPTVMAAVLAGLAAWDGTHRRPLPWWAGLAIVAIAILAPFWALRPPVARGDQAKRVALKLTDVIQRRRLLRLFLMPFMLACLAPSALNSTHDLLAIRGGDTATSWASVGCFTVVIAMTVLELFGIGYGRIRGQALNDELSQAHRAKAIRSGFVAALAGGCGAYIAGVFEPRWAVLSLPAVLAGAIVVAFLHFAFLEIRADAVG